MKYIIFLLFLTLNLFAEENTFKISTTKYSGSAWYYSDTRMFTAAHLFKKDELICHIFKNEQKIHCKVLKIDYKEDICVIETVPNPTWYEVKSLKVVGIGFPNKKTENSGQITKFESNNETIPGMSGGPLIEDGTNQSYGMIVKNGTFGDKKICKIILGSKLLEFIKDIK